MKQKLEMSQETKKENSMRKVKLEKVVLSCGGTGPNLEKGKKLLEILSNRKAKIVKAGPKRRIPAFNVKPGLELGALVTVRGKEAFELLRKLLGAVDNIIKEDKIIENTFSFGIHEYIEIPGIEYIREIGIRGLNVTASFARAGARVKRKKLKGAKIPRKQNVSAEEIINYMKENFSTEIE